MRRLVLVILLGLLGVPVHAQAPASSQLTTGMWANVETVPPGDKLVVKLKDGGTVKGTLSSVTDTRLTLSCKIKTTEVEQGDIVRVYRVAGSSPAKSALIGAGAGAAGGAVIGAVAGRDWVIKTAASVPIGATLFGVIGSVVGYAVGKARQKRVLIYDARLLAAPATLRSAKENSP